MTKRLIYRELPVFKSKLEVLDILTSGNTEEKMILSLSIGENFPDWKFAQDICLKLVDSEDEGVRANACLGLAYIARTKRKLEKHLVKPILIRELKKQGKLQWRIIDSIMDIKCFMEWNIAEKYIEKNKYVLHTIMASIHSILSIVSGAVSVCVFGGLKSKLPAGPTQRFNLYGC